jgi:hypothetical protein
VVRSDLSAHFGTSVPLITPKENHQAAQHAVRGSTLAFLSTPEQVYLRPRHSRSKSARW